MPRGGASVSCSMLPSATRAAKTQLSPTLNSPPAARAKSTSMPFSSDSWTPAAGMRMPSELAEVLRSWNVVPSARRTRPDWSQRRMRVWRSAVVRPWASTGKSPAGSGSSRRMERVAESTPSPGRMRRSRPGRPCSSCQSSRISIHSPAWNPSTSSRPMLSTTRRLPPWISLTALMMVALSRDHLKVAVPRGPPLWTSTR